MRGKSVIDRWRLAVFGREYSGDIQFAFFAGRNEEWSMRQGKNCIVEWKIE
jgi:hypothetical protein